MAPMLPMPTTASVPLPLRMPMLDPVLAAMRMAVPVPMRVPMPPAAPMHMRRLALVPPTRIVRLRPLATSMVVVIAAAATLQIAITSAIVRVI